jgi:hypothetical protein
VCAREREGERERKREGERECVYEREREKEGNPDKVNFVDCLKEDNLD